jgi:hypothetical protein
VRAAAALDQVERRIDLVRAVDRDVEREHVVRRDDTQAEAGRQLVRRA